MNNFGVVFSRPVFMYPAKAGVAVLAYTALIFGILFSCHKPQVVRVDAIFWAGEAVIENGVAGAMNQLIRITVRGYMFIAEPE